VRMVASTGTGHEKPITEPSVTVGLATIEHQTPALAPMSNESDSDLKRRTSQS
jgi:hypothetical protein